MLYWGGVIAQRRMRCCTAICGRYSREEGARRESKGTMGDPVNKIKRNFLDLLAV